MTDEGGGTETFLHIPVEYILIEELLAVEKDLVNNALIKSYTAEIQKILRLAPLRVWKNIENLAEKRVIDGLHRLYSAEGNNKIALSEGNFEEIIKMLPCSIEIYSRDRFLEERKKQTIAHEVISDYRCIDALVDAYAEADFHVPKERVVPLEKVLALHLSRAVKRGKNYLSKYNIGIEELTDMRQFVDNWIREYNLKGAAAYQTLEAINFVGNEDLDIFGLDGVRRDHVKTLYSSLNSIVDMDEKRKYANHILRITAGIDRSRGKIQKLARVVNEGTPEYRQLILDATEYEGQADLIYENFKAAFGSTPVKIHKRVYERQTNEKIEEPSLPIFKKENSLPPTVTLETVIEPANLGEGDDDAEEGTELEPEDPSLDELKKLEEELPYLLGVDKSVHTYKKKVISTRKKAANVKRLKQITGRSANNYIANPGDIIYSYAEQKGHEIAILSGTIYITFDKEDGFGGFYRVDAPYLLSDLEKNFGNEKPRIYAADRVEFHFLPADTILNETNEPLYEQLVSVSSERRLAGLAVAQSAASRENGLGMFLLMQQDFRYSRHYKSYIVATPIDVLRMIAGSSEIAKDYLSCVTNSLKYDSESGIFKVTDPSKFIKTLQGVIQGSQVAMQ